MENTTTTPPKAEYAALCKFCGGKIAIRNPTGQCDHLYWPDMLTDEAKRANGFRKVVRVVREHWEQNNAPENRA